MMLVAVAAKTTEGKGAPLGTNPTIAPPAISKVAAITAIPAPCGVRDTMRRPRIGLCQCMTQQHRPQRPGQPTPPWQARWPSTAPGRDENGPLVFL
jgi:hypothetical protein